MYTIVLPNDIRGSPPFVCAPFEPQGVWERFDRADEFLLSPQFDVESDRLIVEVGTLVECSINYEEEDI